MFVYLDNSATTKPYKEVVDIMLKYIETDYGNPSSLHRMGLEAEKAVKEARKTVAASMGAKIIWLFSVQRRPERGEGIKSSLPGSSILRFWKAVSPSRHWDLR